MAKHHITTFTLLDQDSPGSEQLSTTAVLCLG